MISKKAHTRFTVQFNQTDPSHLKVADILNNQKKHGKAQYIVDAVIHYIGCGLAEPATHQIKLDEKQIELIVKRLLQDMNVCTTDNKPATNNQLDLHSQSQPQIADKITLDCATREMDALDKKSIKAVANALVSFRRK